MNFLLLVCFLFFSLASLLLFVGCLVEVVVALCVAVVCSFCLFVPFVLFTGSGRWWWFDLIDGS